MTLIELFIYFFFSLNVLPPDLPITYSLIPNNNLSLFPQCWRSGRPLLLEWKREQASYWVARLGWWSQVMRPQPLLSSPCSCRLNHWSHNPDAVSPAPWTFKPWARLRSGRIPLRRSRSCIPRAVSRSLVPRGDPRPLLQGQRMRKRGGGRIATRKS